MDDYTANIFTTGRLGIGQGQTAQGLTEISGDEDWFKVSLTKDYAYEFTLSTSASNCYALDGNLYNKDGRLLAFDWTFLDSRDAKFTYIATESTDYYYEAKSYFYPGRSVPYKAIVREVNAPPTSEHLTWDITEDGPISIKKDNIAFYDVNGDNFFSIKITGLPDKGELTSNGIPVAKDAVFYTSGMNLVYTPPKNISGNAIDVIKFKVSDGAEFAKYESWAKINVTPVNDPPIISKRIENIVINEGERLDLTIPRDTFEDADGDVLNISLGVSTFSQLPSWLSYDPVRMRFTGTPSDNDVGSTFVIVRATDPAKAYVENVFTVTVNDVNIAPASVVPDMILSVTEGVSFSYGLPQTLFTDGDAHDQLTITYEDMPTWLSFDSTNNKLQGTPGFAAAG